MAGIHAGEAMFLVALSLTMIYGLAVLAIVTRVARRTPALRDLHPPDPPRWPTLSVIVTARDEAEGLETAVESRLQDGYPALELVLVNDRSRDGTGAIVDALAARDPRVRAVHLRELPDGWLGKVHAMHRGVEASMGDWLLFSDADVHVAPGTLARAVAYCEARGLDHLAVMPDIWSSGAWLDAAITAFLRFASLGARVWSIEDPRSRAAVGGGLFNLVRREALARTEGLAWLKLEVADDVALGQMLKRSGARASVVNACGFVGLQFYRSLGEMARGVEKNGYAVLGRYSMPRLVLNCVAMVALEWLPWLALVFGRDVRVLALGAVGALSTATATVVAARWLRRPIASALLAPFGVALLAGMMLRSGLLAERRGGIVWRGTLYPTSRLREGMRLQFP